MKVRINANEKKKRDREKVSGKRWEYNDDFILAVWEKYKQGKISAQRLMQIFPGRTFKAIEMKVYHIRGARREKYRDPNQLSFPFGGKLS